MPNSATPILELRRVGKSFGSVSALKPVDLSIEPGRILGLVGENGAGKSTLIKLLSGVHQPDAGEVLFQGQVVRFASPRSALETGIATIHQELTYADRLSVAENMLLADEWPRRFWRGVDWRALAREAERRLADFGLSISPAAAMGQLTAAERQEVAIASALARKARVLILDEPTASLSEPEVRRLSERLARLRSQNVAVLYVSHRLDEIFALTDDVAVLRDGALVAKHRTADVSVDALVREMVGRPLDQVYPHRRSRSPGEARLTLTEASRAGMFHDVSFEVRAGEVVGLAGLVGSGRSELARAIYGLYPLESGSITLCGRAWSPASPAEALARGLVYVPEERKSQGFVLSHSLGESISIGFSDRLARFGLIGRRAETSRVSDIIRRFDIRTTGAERPVGTLSGGNQQKALLARWLERDPAVMILDEPTRGVDVGAKAEIHALIDRLASAGKAILVISSDVPEILGVSDRILVMRRGTIGAELRGGDRTEHNVLLAASGMTASSPLELTHEQNVRR